MGAPKVGILVYIIAGEVRLGKRNIDKLRAAIEKAPPPELIGGPILELEHTTLVPSQYASLFRLGRSVNGYPVLGGNRAELARDSDAAIDAIVQDIDQAQDHVHLLGYIWLPDNNGTKMVEALKRASRRGVACRAMADDLGSRILIHSRHWKDMHEAGVRLARALPVGNILLRPLRPRADMRNHRKIVVVDNRIAYCGSQNWADPAFAVKARFAPWIDLVARFEGPVVRQNQHLFAINWAAQTGETLNQLFETSPTPIEDGFAAQVVASDALVRCEAMPEMFISLINAAQHELVISTPYYVPDESIQAALCASPKRGVATTLILPARNDSRIVAAASRSYYQDLLDAGVLLLEYSKGLLHTKSLTVDSKLVLIGSANIDRRSFDLNFENNIMVADPAFAAAVRARQQSYMDASSPVRPQDVEAWSLPQRLWNNAVAMVGPVL